MKNERLIHLKIKIKSLADEAGIIREEARKVSGMERWRLNNHRTGIVRNEARHSLLAYGLIRNIPYEVMERKCEIRPNWRKLMEIAKRFGGEEEQIVTWIAVAKQYILDNSK